MVIIIVAALCCLQNSLVSVTEVRWSGYGVLDWVNKSGRRNKKCIKYNCGESFSKGIKVPRIENCNIKKSETYDTEVTLQTNIREVLSSNLAAGISAVLTEVSRSCPHSLHANADVLYWLGQDRCLSIIFQFFIHFIMVQFSVECSSYWRSD